MGQNEKQNGILSEKHFAEKMNAIVEPYLAEHTTEQYYEREKGRKIFCLRGQADSAHGVVLISHGYTDTAEKYKEVIYYFLKAGYHVYMPEHCGHGRSYRLTRDLSLVHVDNYVRYITDWLYIAEIAKKEFPELPLHIYAHSMGGGIALAAAARKPKLFERMVLDAPMIRPDCGGIPWVAAVLTAGLFCQLGKEKEYLMVHGPYAGREKFEDSASSSRARFDYYQDKKEIEPLFQTCAATYGWFWQMAKLNRELQRNSWKNLTCPVLLLQADDEKYVSNKKQNWFMQKMNHRGDIQTSLIQMPGSRHEIFNSDTETLKKYWRKIFRFLNW